MNSFSQLNEDIDYITKFNNSTEEDLSNLSDTEWYTMAFKFAQRQDDKETECLEYLLLNSNRPKPDIYSLSALDSEEKYDMVIVCNKLEVNNVERL